MEQNVDLSLLKSRTAVSRTRIVPRPAWFTRKNTCSEMAAMFRGRPCLVRSFSLRVRSFTGQSFVRLLGTVQSS